MISETSIMGFIAYDNCDYSQIIVSPAGTGVTTISPISFMVNQLLSKILVSVIILIIYIHNYKKNKIVGALCPDILNIFLYSLPIISV